jgi:hypothetical protein
MESSIDPAILRAGLGMELPHHLKDWSYEEEKACKGAIQRARELHKPYDVTETVTMCETCEVIYPCATIEALNSGK